MADKLVTEDSPATGLFPQFETELYRMISTEVEGLTESQLDFQSERWEWSKWSIRRNLSHMASGDFRWFWDRWGKILFPDGLPNGAELDALMASPFDRRLDENLYWEPGVLLEKLREGLDFAWSILSAETVGSLRRKELESAASGLWLQYPELFPDMVRQAPGDSSRILISLEATFYHRYFEHTTHLYNIQRLKRAQGLDTRVEIPFEGYWALPDWDRSEP